MGTTHFFNPFNLVSEIFDSTQLMTHNRYTRIDSNRPNGLTQNGFLKFDSNRLTTQKASRILWIKSTQDSNRPRSTHDSKKHLAYWFESGHDSMIRINFSFRWPFWVSLNLVDLFGLSINFVDLFWAFRSRVAFVWPFWGIRLKCLDSNQLMTQAICNLIAVQCKRSIWF